MGFSLISTAEIVYHCIMGCFNGKSEEIGSIGETSNDSNKFLCNNQNDNRHSIYFVTVSSFKVVIDQTFGSAELFGRTFTMRFGPNDRTFFCRTQNIFVLHSMPMASFNIFVLLNDSHV